MDEPPVDWQPVHRQRSHEQVLAQIEQRIVLGQLRPGDRLPPERQLAEVLGVSRSAVREALRVLESMGVLDASPGSGPGAGSRIVGGGGPALSTLLRLQVGLSAFSQREVMEVRVQLERWAVREAAGRVTDADVDRLHRLIERMRDEHIDADRFNSLDSELHVAIAEVSGNSLLAALMRGIRDAVHAAMIVVFAGLEDVMAVRTALCDEHAAIVAAVAEGRGEDAATLVQAHIESFYRTATTRRPG
ncbi:transcriptional regulator, GntR family [Jatrophihabitans endophyticus]|uniref:Transcriptional regulator, GntR family n=1 Tax=Jatrophihabitans endophyticus TaxID=1206085 RepID=A0A1M5Q3C3_9ACTN|nr:FadR/GntR family transcriptional regulator [Jatrophihabitans endophyticus]SHH08380.1 transcriptional regulator, GntR family [Jatrophihabitans endophyticus]